MPKLSFSPKSRQDLLGIGDYIAQDSRANARQFVAKLMAQCQRIGHAPKSYVSRDDLAPGLRMAALGRYVIFSACLIMTFVSSAFSMALETCLRCLATEMRQSKRMELEGVENVIKKLASSPA